MFPAKRTPARILLVDDHPLVRAAIKGWLREPSDFYVCGEAADGKEAVEKVLTLKPDVVLMDISMPVMNGIEAIKEIRQLSLETKIIIVSRHDSPQIMNAAKEAGAHGVFVKSGGLHDLQKVILEVLGQRSPRVASTVKSATSRANGRGKTWIFAFEDIFTGTNLFIAVISGLIGYVVFEYLRKKL